MRQTKSEQRAEQILSPSTLRGIAIDRAWNRRLTREPLHEQYRRLGDERLKATALDWEAGAQPSSHSMRIWAVAPMNPKRNDLSLNDQPRLITELEVNLDYIPTPGSLVVVDPLISWDKPLVFQVEDVADSEIFAEPWNYMEIETLEEDEGAIRQSEFQEWYAPPFPQCQAHNEEEEPFMAGDEYSFTGHVAWSPERPGVGLFWKVLSWLFPASIIILGLLCWWLLFILLFK